MNVTHPSRKLLFIVWLGLLGLLFVTWGVAKLDLGKLNIVAALTIAMIKMLLVVLIFMHVKYSPRFTWVFVIAGFFWLAIMICLTLSDYLTRGVFK